MSKMGDGKEQINEVTQKGSIALPGAPSPGMSPPAKASNIFASSVSAEFYLS